jgi:hypothetical protein
MSGLDLTGCSPEGTTSLGMGLAQGAGEWGLEVVSSMFSG